MGTEFGIVDGIDFRDGEYICRKCQLVYIVYGSRLRCDNCDAKLQKIKGENLQHLLEKWGG